MDVRIRDEFAAFEAARDANEARLREALRRAEGKVEQLTIEAAAASAAARASSHREEQVRDSDQHNTTGTEQSCEFYHLYQLISHGEVRRSIQLKPYLEPSQVREAIMHLENRRDF